MSHVLDSNSLKKQFSERISQLRTEKGVSARIMSYELGLNKNYISSVESGKSYPTFSVFLDICDYLAVTPKEFFTYEIESPTRYSTLISRLQTCNDRQIQLLNLLLDEFN